MSIKFPTAHPSHGARIAERLNAHREHTHRRADGHSQADSFQRRAASGPELGGGGGGIGERPTDNSSQLIPLANSRAPQALDASVLAAIPEDLRGGMRNGVPVIRVYNKADVARVPEAVWQFIADRGVYRQNSGGLSKMSADDVKQGLLYSLDSPKGQTNYYLGVALEQMPHDERVAKASGAKFSDAQVRDAIATVRRENPNITDAEVNVLAWRNGVSNDQLNRVRASTDSGTTEVSNDRGVSKWFDTQVLQAMRDATIDGPLTKDQLHGLAGQYAVPDDQFERVYAQFAKG